MTAQAATFADERAGAQALLDEVNEFAPAEHPYERYLDSLTEFIDRIDDGLADMKERGPTQSDRVELALFRRCQERIRSLQQSYRAMIGLPPRTEGLGSWGRLQ
jgi:hypothetical protein